MEKFRFLQQVQSHDHCILGRVVMNEDGEHHVAYYDNDMQIQTVKIDYYAHDWELVKPKKKRGSLMKRLLKMS